MLYQDTKRLEGINPRGCVSGLWLGNIYSRVGYRDMGVKSAQMALEESAISYGTNVSCNSLASLLVNALAYAREKRKAANRRDKWKQKKQKKEKNHG